MIFCVEDDQAIRELMVYALKAAGMEAEGFETGRDFWGAMEKRCPELVVLDIMLPGEDGIHILKKLRGQTATADIPVILATAKGTEYDKVTGLDLGADDYLVKPFGMMEMIARIRAVLRRTGPGKEPKILRAGELELDLDGYAAYLKGQRVDLTLKEYLLLRALMENPGRVLARDQLLELVWGQEFLGETRTVDVHIGTLRAKLGRWGDRIQTVRGVGYRMEGRS